MPSIVHRDNVQRSTMTTFFSFVPAEVWGARGSDPPRRRGLSRRTRGKPWSLDSAPGGAQSSPVAWTPSPWTSPRLTVYSVCVTGPSHGEYYNKTNNKEIETNSWISYQFSTLQRLKLRINTIHLSASLQPVFSSVGLFQSTLVLEEILRHFT